MRIVLTQDAAPRLEEGQDFKRFCIEMDHALSSDASGAVAPVGELDDAGYVWVRPDAVRALSALAGRTEWQDGFAAMTTFAASRGWVDGAGRIRAHIDIVAPRSPVATDVFRLAMRRFPSGVCVVAAGEGEARCGMTVSAFASVSADPPMVLVCLNRCSSAHESLTRADTFSITILAAGQADMALVFAGQRGLHGADRFDDAWTQSFEGAPVLRDAHQSIVCTPSARYVAGSHTVLIGQVVGSASGAGGAALVNYEGALLPVGHAA